MYQKATLANGLRIVCEPISQVHSVSLGVWVGTGTRYEEPSYNGISHFIEHMLFKGTNKRSAKQIAEEIDAVGGQLNAFTTKEYTCVHASLLNQHLERAMDLFEDILFHSTFPDDEQEKERGVILDEIASYLDQPEEAIQDDFEELLFKGHPMGNNILGTPETVARLNRKDIDQFIAANYNTSEMVFAVFGDYDFKK